MDGGRMSSGFYKYESETLLHGPNFVYNYNYTLLREEVGTIDLPLDGWYWFDDIEEACSFFNIENPNNKQEEVNNESI